MMVAVEDEESGRRTGWATGCEGGFGIARRWEVNLITVCIHGVRWTEQSLQIANPYHCPCLVPANDAWYLALSD